MDRRRKHGYFENKLNKKERVFFMKVYSEKEFKDFEFWGGAKDRAEKLTDDEGNMIFDYLEECYPEGLTETEINDFFWFIKIFFHLMCA